MMMKLTPFLFEVSAEALTKFYKDKFIQIFKSKEYTNQVDDLYREGITDLSKGIGDVAFNLFLDVIFSIDPTKGKDYSRWLIERWLSEGIKLEDKDKIREYLGLFHTHKKNLPVKDIGRIKSSGELFKILKDAGVIGVSVSGINPGELQALVQSKDIKFMGDLPKWLVYVPITVKGSCYLGKETEWCTAKYKEGDERNMFNYYNKDGELWVFINKQPSGAEPTKIQIHFDSGQIMDQDDQDYDKDLLKQNYPEVVEFLRQQTKQDKQTLLFTEFWDDEIKLGVLVGTIQYHGELLVIDDFELNQEIWNTVSQDLVDNGGRLNFVDCMFNNIDFGTKLPKKLYTCKLDDCKIHLYQKITLKNCVVTSCAITRDDGYDSNIFIDGSEFMDTTIVECNLTGTGRVMFNECTFTYQFSMGNVADCSFNGCNFTNAIGGYFRCKFTQCNFSQQWFKEVGWYANDVINKFEHCKLDDYTKQQIPYNEVLKEGQMFKLRSFLQLC